MSFFKSPHIYSDCFGQFLIGLFILLLSSCKCSLLYSRYKPLSRYMLHSFSIYVGCPFIFLMKDFEAQNFLTFEVHFIFLSFVAYAFGVLSKNLLPHPWITFETESSDYCVGDRLETELQGTKQRKECHTAPQLHQGPNAEPWPPDWGLGSEPWKVAQTQAQILTLCPYFLFLSVMQIPFVLPFLVEPGWTRPAQSWIKKEI